MREVAPLRERWLDDDVLANLCELTQVLIVAKTRPRRKHAHFLAITERGLCLPEAELADGFVTCPSW